MLTVAPMLVADVGGLIAVAFMVISFIGWLSNLINGTQKKGPKGQTQPKPRSQQNKRLRDEIESFLQEATGQKKEGGAPARPASRSDELMELEQIEATSSKSRPPPPVSKRSQPPRPQKSKGGKSQPASAPRRSLSQEAPLQPMESRSLGQGVRQHVDQHLAPRGSSLAPQSLEPAAIGSQFGSQLQPRLTVSDAFGERQSKPSIPMNLQQRLREQQGVREAFVMAEILKPPVALRGSRRSGL